MPPRVDGAPTYRPAVPYLPTRRRDIVPNSQPPPITLLISTPEQAGAARDDGGSEGDEKFLPQENCRAYIWMRGGLDRAESKLVVLLLAIGEETDVCARFLGYSGCVRLYEYTESSISPLYPAKLKNRFYIPCITEICALILKFLNILRCGYRLMNIQRVRERDTVHSRIIGYLCAAAIVVCICMRASVCVTLSIGISCDSHRVV